MKRKVTKNLRTQREGKGGEKSKLKDKIEDKPIEMKIRLSTVTTTTNLTFKHEPRLNLNRKYSASAKTNMRCPSPRK